MCRGICGVPEAEVYLQPKDLPDGGNELDAGQDQDISEEEDEDSGENLEEHTDAEIGKKHEDHDVENLMFPDAEKPDAETPDAEDFTTPTDVSDYYCDASAYETRTASCLQPWLHTSRADRVCFTSSRILTFLNALQIQVEWSWSRKFMFQLLIFVFVGEQVGQVDPEGDQAEQGPQQWYGLAGNLLLAQPGESSAQDSGEEGECGGGPHLGHSQAWQEVPQHRVLRH